MKSQNRYNATEDTGYETNETCLAPVLDYSQVMPIDRRDFGSKALAAITPELEYNVTLEKARATLTFHSMQNAQQLALARDALVESVPSSAPYVNSILSAYAVGASLRVAKY